MFLERMLFAVMAAVLFCFGSNPALSFTLSETTQWQTQNETLTPLAYEGGVVFGAGDKTLEAWDIDKGQPVWQTALPSAANFKPRLTDDVVIASGRNHLGAYNRKTGKRIWLYEKETQIAVPFILDGAVYFGDGGRFLAVSLEDGTKLWSHTITGGAEIFYGAIGRDGIVYLGAGDGLVYAFDAKTGDVLWRFDNEADWQYLRQLYLSNGILIAGGYHDEVFAIRLGNQPADQRIQWRFYAGNFINSQLVHADSVYFWSPTGWVYALDTQTGKRRWRHGTHKFASYKSDWGPVMAELQMFDDALLVLDMKRQLHVISAASGEKKAEVKLAFAPRPFVLPVAEKQVLLFADLQGRIRVHAVTQD